MKSNRLSSFLALVVVVVILAIISIYGSFVYSGGKLALLQNNPQVKSSYTPPASCTDSCEVEEVSLWEECTYCDPSVYTPAECIQREVACRIRAVTYRGVAPEDYPAPISSFSQNDRIAWFNYSRSDLNISCGTSCGTGAICCYPPDGTTTTPTRPTRPTLTPLPTATGIPVTTNTPYPLPDGSNEYCPW